MVNAVVSHETTLDSLLEKVHHEAGYDFRGYKRGTVTRRLERRLHATKAKTYSDYLQFLDTHPEEYQRLADDITIKVSGFFRSPYAFQQVVRLVLPEMALRKQGRGERELKFWSSACARGEEPYSIAIMLSEFLGEQRQNFNISVYATDVSRQALNDAEIGLYLPKEVENIFGPAAENYFSHRDGGYMVKNDIRQMLRFSYFDLTSDTPHLFGNMDCIFCCNILIYLQRQHQENVLNMLYDSLATPGYLILGEGETPTNDLCRKLVCLDAKARIYKKD